MNDEKWIALQQAEDMAYFKADLCCYSPESYSLDEKKAICNDMISTSKAALDAMRGRPPTAPSALGRHNPSEHPFVQFSCPFSSDKP